LVSYSAVTHDWQRICAIVKHLFSAFSRFEPLKLVDSISLPNWSISKIYIDNVFLKHSVAFKTRKIKMNMTSKSFFTTCLILLQVTFTNAQVGIGTSSPAASAKLEISSTTQGLLPPRMTTAQRDQISSPAIGLIIFNTTSDKLEIRTSSGWLSLQVVSSSQEVASVKIGNQIWMLENLNVSTYRDGSPIAQVTNQATWDNLSTGAMCDYLNDQSYADIYGKLYNFYAVIDPRGLCPSGWHVPSDAEFTTLTNFLGGNAGGKMKSAGFKTPNKGATNSSGFTALPGGSRIWGGGGFAGESVYGAWWTSTGLTATTAYDRELGDGYGVCFRSSPNKTSGNSVRCIKD
jgi:uncharacterized protein (TIGR02145 family)